jgi:ComF family protein
VYAGGARDTVRKLKYEGKRCLAAPMAAMMEFRLRTRSAMSGADCIVPVALHPRKLRQRGYNQSSWLAEELAVLCGLPVLHALERTRETRSQVGLGSAERQANLAGAFRASTGCAGRNVLLVDDVTTTGATAREASRALLDASCSSVRLITFARDL